MKRRFLLTAALIASLTVGCTAPGEPPSHPSSADYHDLIRRETAKSQSAIATAQVVVDQLRQQRITRNYATVSARQAYADIEAVITDLGHLTAPTRRLKRAQQILQRLLIGASTTVASIPYNWSRQPQLWKISLHLATTAKQAERLDNLLD